MFYELCGFERKAEYLRLNRRHKQHQGGVGSSEMPSAGFGRTAVKDR